MKKIGIVGKCDKNFPSYLRENYPEYELIAFHDYRESHVYPDFVQNIYVIDAGSMDSVSESVTQLGVDFSDLVGLVNIYENAVVAKNLLANFFKLPGMSVESALCATDKIAMRKAFLAADKRITPNFALVSSVEDLREFVFEYRFPLMLKPANLSKSLLVTKATNFDDLVNEFNRAIDLVDQVYSKHGVFGKKPQFLVEEFMNGRVYSIDLVVEADGNCLILPPVGLVTADDCNIDDFYHYKRFLPCDLSADEINEMNRVAIMGVKAMDLRSTFAHVELMCNAGEVKIIEIGARNGGYRAKMYGKSYGVDFYKAILDLAMGNKVSWNPEFNSYSAVYELFPSALGVFDGISNLDELKTLNSFVSINIPTKRGDQVGLARDGFKFAANVFLANKDKAQFERDSLYVEENLKVRIS
jgi:D-alanine-D-alanine ligase-like ATP-grasp enzyme